MRSKYTWVLMMLMVELAAARGKDYVILKPDPFQHRPRVPCEQFDFTCSVDVSLVQRPVRATPAPYLVLYLANHGPSAKPVSCHGDRTLDNRHWGGAVWTSQLTANMTYGSTKLVGRDSWHSIQINAGLITMTPDGVNFRFTIYKVRPHLGKHPWCFTCRLEFQPRDAQWMLIDHKTVEMEVADVHGGDKMCREQEGRCHLAHTLERQGYQYERKISDSECTNCTCTDGGNVECDPVTSCGTCQNRMPRPCPPGTWLDHRTCTCDARKLRHAASGDGKLQPPATLVTFALGLCLLLHYMHQRMTI